MKKIGVGAWSCSDRERELVNLVLNSGRLSYGPMSQKLEHEFAAVHGCKHAVLSNSGTSSLQIALQAMKELHGWADGDQVMVPAITFVATVNIILHNRLTPVLVDVDPYTYNMDVEGAMWRVNDDVRAIIPVHMFGQPANMNSLIKLRPESTLVIEDACEAAFAFLEGRPVGSFGDIGCFSTYIAHLLTTGVGGISTTNNPDYAIKMRSLANHGRDGIYMDIDTKATREVISRRFRFESIGHSYRITEMEAALGVAQLESWRDMIEARESNAQWLMDNLNYLEEVKGYIQLPHILDGAEHSWMMFPIVVLSEDKWGLVNHLEGCGIETREMMPLTNQPCYAGMWREADYPNAAFINEHGFYIGCHQYLTQGDLHFIVESIFDYFIGW